MNEQEDIPPSEAKANDGVFLPGWPQYNKPSRIVTLGHYYPEGQIAVGKQILKEARGEYNSGAPADPKIIRKNLGWTNLLNALNEERQWPLKRLFALLDPMLEADIAITIVPTHLAYQAFWPTCTLARHLAANGRIDATTCLVRHTTIHRITFGGPSTRTLHRQTIRGENLDLIAGKRVLLLDDIAKSGASLMACREILYEAGATLVQGMALGRVLLGDI